MDSAPTSSPNPTARRFVCRNCGAECWATGADQGCPRCGGTVKPEPYASAILSPSAQAIDETLTAYLAAPLPEEALMKTANPANLFGKYVFLRQIGSGASGTVIKAWDTYLSRHVALKFLHASASRTMEVDDTQRVQDFLREARLAARLRHPNIVQIHEVDFRDGRYFISMDFIGGDTLADRIHDAPGRRVRTRFYLDPRRFIELLKTIALAVHHAHRQTPPVVHRDLKPQNVLLDVQDKPYVADFGLANEVQVGPQAGGGGIRGTPAYMAPEQALGRTEDIDPRTDVYSLGVILYEMLAGEAPFKGENIPSVLRKVATERPEAPGALVKRVLKKSREVAACPKALREDLDRICLKALEKDRDHRYQSALEFAEALGASIEKHLPTRPATEPPPVRLRPTFVKAGLAAGLIVLLGAAIAFRPQGPGPAQAQAAAPAVDPAPAVSRDADLVRHRKEWTALMERFLEGGEFPSDLRTRLSAFPEIRDELRSELRRTLGAREAALVEEARAATNGGPASWKSEPTKARAATLRSRLTALLAAAAAAGETLEERPLTEALAGLDALLTYRGTWSIRINIAPFAEYRLLDGDTERARDFTPSFLRDLDLGPTEPLLELCWPSISDPRLRSTCRLPSLAPGETLVVSGELKISSTLGS